MPTPDFQPSSSNSPYQQEGAKVGGRTFQTERMGHLLLAKLLGGAPGSVEEAEEERPVHACLRQRATT